VDRASFLKDPATAAQHFARITGIFNPVVLEVCGRKRGGTFTGGQVVITQGVAALPEHDLAQLLERVRRARHGGWISLLLSGSANAINATLYDKLTFDFVRDITPVAGIVRVPLIVVVNPAVSAKTIPESLKMNRLLSSV
jgi:hypothetical protein